MVIDEHGAFDVANIIVSIYDPELGSPIQAEDGKYQLNNTTDQSLSINLITENLIKESENAKVIRILSGNGRVTHDSNVTITYNPEDGFTGSDSFVYVISNGLVEAQGVITVDVFDDKPFISAQDFIEIMDLKTPENIVDLTIEDRVFE